MCKYQIFFDGEIPMCEYTKKPCTICVLGNSKTYEEAEAKMKGESE
jgi:hypothetical protein